MNYDKINNGVAFKEDTHTYFNVNNLDIKYISVTTLIEKFTKPFDKEFWSAYKALEKLLDAASFKLEKGRLLDTKKIDIDYFKRTYSIDDITFNLAQQDILDQWQSENRKSCERGTAIHSKLEHQYLDVNTCELPKFGLGGKFTVRSGDVPLDEEKGVYPEYLIHVDDGDLHLAGQIDLLIKDRDEILIVDYKGLPLDTPIATPNGFTTMCDLKVGDKVFDKDGNICNVIVKSSIHNNPCYRIKFDNAESIVADMDHRWLVSFSRSKSKYKEKVMTTIELKEYLESIKDKRSTYNIPKIVNSKPLKTIERDLPIDPYVLGCWLGDGSKSCGIITNGTNNIWEEIQARGYEIGPNLSDDSHIEMRTIYGLYRQLRLANLIKNKHIPDNYLFASYEQRLDLLRGFMDTDGYYNPIRKRFVMATDQEWQKNALVKLLATFGIKATVFDIVTKLDGKEFPGWQVWFSTLGLNPFLSRNQDIEFPYKDNCTFRVIEDIEEVETVPTQCIQVDSESHTYLAGYSMIVTHNTNKKIELKGYFNKKTKQTEKMKYPLSDLDDVNFSYYTLQLSIYAWMIQHNNPNFKIKLLRLIHFDHSGNITEYDVEYKKSTVERLLRYWKKLVKIEERKALRKEIEF